MTERVCVECGLTLFCDGRGMRAHYDAHLAASRPAKAVRSVVKPATGHALSIDYELTSGSNGPTVIPTLPARIRDTRGLSIASEKAPRIGSRMVVRFSCPNGYRVIAFAEVRDVLKRPRGFFVEFLKLDNDDREQIEAWLYESKPKTMTAGTA